jgi:outer membrane protein|tara:strand:+ start:207 stop:731 length:525 start_codon:yes stop_codon:yes gene_type:complete
MKIKALLLIIFFIFFSKVSISQENKTVYLDLNMIMENSNAGKSINSQLETNHKKNIANFQKLEEELKNEEIKIISQKTVISKEDFEKKIMNLRDKANKYRKERNDSINNLNNQRLNATQKMITLIRPILSEYSDNNSISLIIQKRNIIIGKTSLDITDDILKIIDKKIEKISLD